MKKAKFYLEQRAEKIEAQEALLETAKSEEREFTESEQEAFDNLNREIEELKSKADKAKVIEDAEKRNAAAKFNRSEKSKGTNQEPFNLLRYLSNYKLGRAHTGAELEEFEKATAFAERAGVDVNGIPLTTEMLNRAITVGGNGSNWVPTENGAFIDALRDKMVMPSLGAQFLTGLEGDIQLPRMVAGVAQWEGETDENADSGADTEKVTMSPKRVGALTTLSSKFLKQTSPSTTAMFANDLVRAIALAVDYAAINGGGGDAPTGILNTTNIGVVPIDTNGGAPTYQKIVDLEKEVAVSNAENGALNYLANPQGRAKLKTTSVDGGSGKFLWTSENTVNGYNTAVSNGVPSDLTKGTGTNLSALIYGNFNDLVIGQWGVIDLIVDPFSKKTSAQIEIAANAYFDVAVRHPQSFAAIKDMVTS